MQSTTVKSAGLQTLNNKYVLISYIKFMAFMLHFLTKNLHFHLKAHYQPPITFRDAFF